MVPAGDRALARTGYVPPELLRLPFFGAEAALDRARMRDERKAEKARRAASRLMPHRACVYHGRLSNSQVKGGAMRTDDFDYNLPDGADRSGSSRAA